MKTASHGSAIGAPGHRRGVFPVPADPLAELQDRVKTLEARVESLEVVCGAAYQLAGEVGAPDRVLDVLFAAANGDDIPAESFLPVTADECREVASTRHTLAQVLDVLEPYLRKRSATKAGSARSDRKAAASRENGRKGGRPRTVAIRQ